jgi:hypothetical protein
LERTPHRKEEEILLLYVGMQKSHGENLGNYKAKTAVCISNLVSHGKYGEDKEPTANLQGRYLRAAVESIRTTFTESLEVAICETPLDLTVTEAARCTACRLKCQGEWRDMSLFLYIILILISFFFPFFFFYYSELA